VGLALRVCVGLFQLSQGLEFSVPAPFQCRRHQAVGGIDRILLALGELDCIARWFPLLFPLLLQCVALVRELLDGL
jgi:hypothetical protein